MTSRLPGSSSRKIRGWLAWPVGGVDVVPDVLFDIQIRAVFEAILHRAMGVFFKPFPKVGGDGPGLASAA